MANADFPPLAGQPGETWRIFLEPISGSGERIIAGVVARMADGNAKSINALNPKSLECVYGRQGLVLAKYADEILDQARDYVAQHGTLSGFASVYSGFQVMPAQQGFADTAAELAQSEILLGASFALHRGKPVDADARDEGRHSEKVQKLVLQKHERLSKHFGYKHHPFKSARPVTVYYSSPRLIANFTRFSPENMNYFEGRTKIKIFDLISIQRGTGDDQDGLFEPQEDLFEMLLLTPKDETVKRNTTGNQYNSYRSALRQFEKLGDAEQIRVRQLHSVKAAADYIISRSPQ